MDKTKEFIDKAIKVHGDRYDYSKVNYINSNTKVIIICPLHDDFEQLPNNHFQGNGCKRCSLEKLWVSSNNSSKENFKENAIKVHGDKYDYSNVVYVNAKTLIQIICKQHGIFELTPNKHLNNRGCQLCSKMSVQKMFCSTTKMFIEKAIKTHGDKYNYSKVNYINSKTKVIIICLLHGEFEQTPHCHLSGNKCKHCSLEEVSLHFRSNKEEFIKKSIKTHGDIYNYSKVNYINSQTKVIIICPLHGDFEQQPNNHINKQGCPRCPCIKKYSCAQVKWLNFMMKYYDLTIHHAENGGEYSIPTTKYKADGFCKETNTIYEFHGDFWHGNPDIYDTDQLNPISKKTFGALYQKTIEKEQHLKQLGYNVVVMWENKWNKIIRSIRLLQKLYHSSTNRNP
jgi:hypothetical protein